jgi:hypothetical protein
MGNIVSRSHPGMPPGSLFAVGMCLGMQVGVEMPAAAERYVAAIRKVLAVQDGGLAAKMAETLELLTDEGVT